MKQHLSNASWSGFTAAFRAFYNLLNVLLVAHLLGPESYGKVVVLLSFFTLYFTLTTNFFTMLIVKLMSESNLVERRLLFASGALWVTLCVSFLVITIAIFGIFSSSASSKFYWLHSPETMHLLYVISILTSIQIIGAFQLAMIEGAGRLDIAMSSQLLGPCAVLVIMLLAMISNIQLSSISYIMILCFAALIDLYMARKYRRKYLNMNIEGLRSADVWRTMHQLFKMGSLLQATTLMNLFLEPFNKSLLNGFIGGTAVTIYDFDMKIIWGIQNIFTSAMRVFLHIVNQNPSQLETSYLSIMRLISVPVLLLHVLACVFLAIIAQYWLILDSRELTLFFAIATLSNLGMLAVIPLYNGLIGTNNTFFIFKIQVRLGVINVFASLLLIPLLGVLGAAAGLLLATLYNSYAILDESKKLTGNDQLTNQLICNLGPKFGLATILFFLAVYSGVYTNATLSLGLFVTACVLIMLPFEPAVIYLIASFGRSIGKH